MTTTLSGSISSALCWNRPSTDMKRRTGSQLNCLPNILNPILLKRRFQPLCQRDNPYLPYTKRLWSSSARSKKEGNKATWIVIWKNFKNALFTRLLIATVQTPFERRGFSKKTYMNYCTIRQSLLRIKEIGKYNKKYQKKQKDWLLRHSSILAVWKLWRLKVATIAQLQQQLAKGILLNQRLNNFHSDRQLVTIVKNLQNKCQIFGKDLKEMSIINAKF